MRIGERIRFFRHRCGMTQSFLGSSVGFSDCTADVRISQYENGARKPKAELLDEMARVLGVAPQVLRTPDIDSVADAMHILFALEDSFGLAAGLMGDDFVPGTMAVSSELGGVDRAGYAASPYLAIDAAVSDQAHALHEALCEWASQAARLRAGKITQEEYDNWRYAYQ